MPPLLDIHIQQKRFADKAVLKDLRLTLQAGEFVAVVGPSGAGKSTLLNLIAGLDQCYQGYLHYQQAPLHQNQPACCISFMFQQARLMPWLSALDNVLLVLDNTPEQRQRAIQLLEAVGLQDSLKHFPTQLSGGMQRRVALARAFAVQPQLLLMDEPFISLDAPTAQRLRDVLSNLWQQQQPVVLFVTHQLREALALADRIIFLADHAAPILLEYCVDLPRPRQLEDPVVQALQQRLLCDYPDLLRGMV